ncbi:hydrolase [Clostridium oryzae]|uniref:Keto-hydroxyglutarate-aldolase/keto-deoxy-phosphogluconate aldolase n=1 Tax=Clostridium oryzae TaxID=1450648 RepID=A0A1V4IFF3_9CLOT|nr:hydrolase [Clostridium oryzae]OPJ58385.1 keto-hydroxyglutarate-aldolase/keto-deoxy-phosphogluconate aldolase [Clostridium oryzae]
MAKFVPEITGSLRNHIIELPNVIRNASGIKVFGKRLKSFIFTTDVSIIRNHNADAIIAVYPFTPQPIITQSLIEAADVPVFCGVGGGTTTGRRVVDLALDAEFKGALGVVVNSPTSNDIIREMKKRLQIPIVVTVVSEFEDIEARIESGATIFNVSAAKRTAYIVQQIRSKFPQFPIIATGGPSSDSINETIAAGANAITYTPPTAAKIMSGLMTNYREVYKNENNDL